MDNGLEGGAVRERKKCNREESASISRLHNSYALVRAGQVQPKFDGSAASNAALLDREIVETVERTERTEATAVCSQSDAFATLIILLWHGFARADAQCGQELAQA